MFSSTGIYVVSREFLSNGYNSSASKRFKGETIIIWVGVWRGTDCGSHFFCTKLWGVVRGGCTLHPASAPYLRVEGWCSPSLCFCSLHLVRELVDFL